MLLLAFDEDAITIAMIATFCSLRMTGSCASLIMQEKSLRHPSQHQNYSTMSLSTLKK
jgi:hypothetical protein